MTFLEAIEKMKEGHKVTNFVYPHMKYFLINGKIVGRTGSGPDTGITFDEMQSDGWSVIDPPKPKLYSFRKAIKMMQKDEKIMTPDNGIDLLYRIQKNKLEVNHNIPGVHCEWKLSHDTLLYASDKSIKWKEVTNER